MGEKKEKQLTPTVMLYDTTLRDGSQAEDISFSVEDKLRIAQKIDELGICLLYTSDAADECVNV